MAEQRKFQAIKGVRDILPPESALWNRVEQTAREVFATYGYGEIRLPIFEQTELFARAVGGDTDIVSKEMYTFRYWPSKEFEHYVVMFSADVGSEITNPHLFSQFQNSLERFVRLLKTAWDQNEIPRHPRNEEVIRELQQLTNQMHQLTQLSADQFASAAPEVQRLAEIACQVVWEELDSGPSQTLRPEATASVCRAYIEHGMHTLPGNVKLYYIGPMFRRERPQKGRYRQFYQIGAEVLGQSDAPAIDAEVIEMLLAFFDRCGLAGYETHVNSIGCKECRPKYVTKLKEALIEHINELKADSQRRVETNPLRVLDSKLPEEQAVIEKLPRITDHLCEACREHYAEVKKQLALRGVAYQENWRLVRGLDYYMRTTFEITAPGLGAQNAVCGGGRYDGLVELLGGQPTKGIGFAIGTDRLILAIQDAEAEKSFIYQSLEFPDVLVTGTTPSTWHKAIEIASILRKNGLRVYAPEPGTKLKKSLDLANRIRIRVAVIVGENELKDERIAIRILDPFDASQPRDGSIKEADILNYGRLIRNRAEIENCLRKLGPQGRSHFASDLSLKQMVKSLQAVEAIPSNVANELTDFIAILNAALHGQLLTPSTMESAALKGRLLLFELENLMPSSEKS